MSFPAGELRVSDAERDQGVAELSEHFQAGRLTQDEFDDRCGRALRARTGRELSELFADLPGGDESWSDMPLRGDASWADMPLRDSASWADMRLRDGGSWADMPLRDEQGKLVGPATSWRPPTPAASPDAAWPEQSACHGRSGRVVILGVVAAVVTLGFLANGSHISLGWLVPLLAVMFVLRRLGRR